MAHEQTSKYVKIQLPQAITGQKVLDIVKETFEKLEDARESQITAQNIFKENGRQYMKIGIRSRCEYKELIIGLPTQSRMQVVVDLSLEYTELSFVSHSFPGGIKYAMSYSPDEPLKYLKKFSETFLKVLKEKN